MTKAIKASEFKAKCLALIDEVAASGAPLTITKNGKPLVDLVPHQSKTRNAFGVWKDSVKITGDIVSPIDVEWEAMK
jgi:prevent-host-death family protein